MTITLQLSDDLEVPGIPVLASIESIRLHLPTNTAQIEWKKKYLKTTGDTFVEQGHQYNEVGPIYPDQNGKTPEQIATEMEAYNMALEAAKVQVEAVIKTAELKILALFKKMLTNQNITLKA